MVNRNRTLVWGGFWALTAFALLFIWLRMSLKHSLVELEKRIDRATEKARLRFEKLAEQIKTEIEQEHSAAGS
ncbi:MAG: hypothetical protein ACOC41_07190 [Chitinivibrionales bacterium]